jgi:hypothetical protein
MNVLFATLSDVSIPTEKTQVALIIAEAELGVSPGSGRVLPFFLTGQEI